MRKEDLKHQIFTIPNILTYIRILAIPAFIVFTVNSNTYIGRSAAYPGGFPVIGLIIMAAAAATDLVDGFIARKFNMGSDLGIMIDPLADKLMHVSALLSLVIIGYVHWAFIVLLFLKEGLMIVGGIVLAGNSKLIKANMMGKVASFTLSIAIFLSFFHPFFKDRVFYLDWIILSIGLVLTYAAFSYYLKQTIAIAKAVNAEKRLKKEAGGSSEDGAGGPEHTTGE